MSKTRSRNSQVSKDRKSTRLNSSHLVISYAVFCLKKKILRQGNKNEEVAVYPHVPAGSFDARRAEDVGGQELAYAEVKAIASGNPAFFFFNDTATTEIYPLPLHGALPIWWGGDRGPSGPRPTAPERAPDHEAKYQRSEEHTSELQSRSDLVCRLLLEK